MPDAQEALASEARPETDADLLHFAIEAGCGVGRQGYAGPLALAEIFKIDAQLVQREVGSKAIACVRDPAELRGERFPTTTFVNWAIESRVPVSIKPAIRQQFAQQRQAEIERPAREVAEAETAAEKRRERIAFYRAHVAVLELLVRLLAENLSPEEALSLVREEEPTA
jgi:hypothetical protein